MFARLQMTQHLFCPTIYKLSAKFENNMGIATDKLKSINIQINKQINSIILFEILQQQ